MKTYDCDQVFDALTRGPFPAGEASDRHVERHLACCHECRALAEALRPAVDLFHEAIEPEECRDLPGYQGRLEPMSAGALRVMAAIEREPRPSSRLVPKGKPVQNAAWWERFAANPWRLSAALALGMSLAMIGWIGWQADNAPLIASVGRYAPTEQGRIALAALPLERECFHHDASSATLSYQCCTKCHGAGAGKTAATTQLLAAVVSSCQACHP